MEPRLWAVGLALGAWGLAARRWGAVRPGLWRLSWGALAGASAAAAFAPGASPAAPAVFAVLGALYVRSGPAVAVGEAAAWARALSAGALAAAFLGTFFIQAFRIPTGSMEDTLLPGDRVLVWKAAYGLRWPAGGRRWAASAPRRGDVLAFVFPTEDPEEVHCTGPQKGRGWLKRVVGVPGDALEMRGGELFRDGRPAAPEAYAKRTAAAPCAKPPVSPSREEYQRLWESRRLDMEVGDGVRDHFGPVTVPEGAAFVLGDNRDASCDSRFWGPVWDRYLLGRAVLVYWPPSRVGFIPRIN